MSIQSDINAATERHSEGIGADQSGGDTPDDRNAYTCT